MINRIIYLGYYLKKLDWFKLKRCMNYVSNRHKISKFSQWKGIIFYSFKYNISILEYYLFNFYNRPKPELSTFAGTGYMYEYQLLMNPKSAREILNNKLLFLKEYAPFIRHNFIGFSEIDNQEKLDEILNNHTGKIVLKNSVGQCGEGVLVIETKGLNTENLQAKLTATGNDLIEDFIQQHDHLSKLSDSGLNTVRIITQLNKKDEVEILGARLRITINSSVDNLAAGNIAASINIKTGIVEGEGVFSDITKASLSKHPITKILIVGFQVPFWNESVEMVKQAALLHKQNRSIGWDVAITNNGPELLEGNHDWCKLLWQLPVKKGLKPLLEKHKKEYLESI